MKVNLAGERGAGQVPLIQRPADGAVVSGRIEVRVQADAGEKGNVVLLVDGRLRAISNVPPFNFELDTDRMAEGLHTLQVQVHGHDGEIVSSPVSAFRVARSEPEPEVVVKSVRPAGELTLVSKAPKQSSEGLVAGSRDMQVSAQASLPRASGEVVSLAQQRQALSLRTASGVAAGKKVDSWRMELTAGPSRRTEEAVSVEIPKTTAGAEASISASEQYCRLPRAMQQLTSSVFPQRVKGQAVSLAPIAPAATEGCGTSLPMETESGIKPEAAASAPAGMEPERVVSEGIRLHIAKQGDCLWSLARRYGTTVTSIAEANGLKDINRIHVGQRLWIPTGPTLHVDGKPLTTEAGPFFHKGKLMIPLRAIVEACGGEVNWDAENHRVGLEIAGTRVILGIGESRALVNDQMIVLDGQVLLQANRTFIALDSLRELAVLPARFELEENRIEVARMTR
jgi:LysM repeat protein